MTVQVFNLNIEYLKMVAIVGNSVFDTEGFGTFKIGHWDVALDSS